MCCCGAIARSVDLCHHHAMDMREIMMIIGEDDPAGLAVDVSGPVWLWHPEPPAKGSWYFLTISGPVAEAIRAQAGGRNSGWGAVRVTATIGATCWQTSLFPNKQLGGYMLPLKADVRRKEQLNEGDIVAGTLTL